MNKINIFCFGFGQVAEAFINKLIDRNINFKLGITSRKDTHQIEINNIKINSYMFENDKFDESINNELEKANYILISIPPVNGEDLVIKNFGISLKKTIIVSGLPIFQQQAFMVTIKVNGLMKKVLLSQLQLTGLTD